MGEVVWGKLVGNWQKNGAILGFYFLVSIKKDYPPIHSQKTPFSVVFSTPLLRKIHIFWHRVYNTSVARERKRERLPREKQLRKIQSVFNP